MLINAAFVWAQDVKGAEQFTDSLEKVLADLRSLVRLTPN